MKITVSTSSVPMMIENLKELKAGILTKEKLHKTLLHKDYQVEFARYNQEGMPLSTIPMEEYEEYLLNCLNLEEAQVENPRLRMRHKELVEFINSIESFSINVLDKLNANPKVLQVVESNLKNGLDDRGFNSLKELNIISTIGIGNSFGYPYENFIHFDAMRMQKVISDEDSLIAFISHETHHVLMNNIFSEIKFESPLDYFITSFSFEGLAVKFNNNAIGTLSKVMYPDRNVNVGLEEDTWDFLKDDFEFMMKHLKNDIKRIKDENISMDGVQNFLNEYWMTTNAVSEATGKTMNISHYRIYYVGNEIFGTLYDHYGKEELFKIIRNPSSIIERFNAVTEEKYHLL